MRLVVRVQFRMSPIIILTSSSRVAVVLFRMADLPVLKKARQFSLFFSSETSWRVPKITERKKISSRQWNRFPDHVVEDWTCFSCVFKLLFADLCHDLFRLSKYSFIARRICAAMGTSQLCFDQLLSTAGSSHSSFAARAFSLTSLASGHGSY
jgi:hypothetical protein